MIGITHVSVYIPRYRIPRATIAAAWGTRSQPGSKSVCNFDEDTLTMAQSAAWPLISGASVPDRLYFASTSAPYWQRSTASQVAAACDLPATTGTMDYGGTLRAGTSAMLAALDAVAAGACRTALVVASDKRDGAPESAEEMAFSDAAAAVIIGSDNLIAEIIAVHSRSDDFPDEWRRDRDWFVQAQASKYSLSRGLEENVKAASRAVLEKAGVDPSQVAVTAHAAPNLGATGCPMPLLALAHTLSVAKPGDLILCTGYGDGADALLLRVVRPAPAFAQEDRTIEYPSYPLWRKSRDFLRESSGAPEVSNVLWKFEEHQNIRLHGTRCEVCGRVQFPITRVCGACRSSEQLTELPLGRKGHVFTFTKDYLYDAPVQPTVMVVVDLEAGGRFLCQMTDVKEREVRIGMPVELMLRRLRDSAQNHHYYWKCRPL